MTVASAQSRSKLSAADLFRIALIVWTIILIAVAVRVLVRPQKTVFVLFAQTGQHWLAGQEIYVKGEYRYSPLVAAILVPLGILPLRLSSMIWLVLNAVLFFWGFFYWAKIALPNNRPRWVAPIILLLATPILIGNFANLQSNAMVLGLMLGSIAGTIEKRWNLVTLCILAATLLKIYPLALGLVLVVQYPRELSWRLLIALAISALLPFILQHPTYVADRYRQWLWVLQHDDRTQYGAIRSYKDIGMLWRTWIGPTNATIYKSIQLIAAGVIGLIALIFRATSRDRKGAAFPQPESTAPSPSRLVNNQTGDRNRLTILLGSVLLWILIFGPATESATHMLVGPLLGWMIVESFLAPWPRGLTILILLAYALLISSNFALTMPWGRKYDAMGIQPAAELLVAIGFTLWAIMQSPAATPPPEPAPKNA